MTEFVVGLQIQLFVFHTAPQAINKHIVQPTTFAAHADLGFMFFEQTDKFLAGKMATLIGIEDLRGGCRSAG